MWTLKWIEVKHLKEGLHVSIAWASKDGVKVTSGGYRNSPTL